MCAMKHGAMILMLAMTWTGLSWGKENSVSIRVRTGDTLIVGAGREVKTSVSIGAAPSSRNRCSRAEVDTGAIRQVTVGQAVSVNLALPGEKPCGKDER